MRAVPCVCVCVRAHTHTRVRGAETGGLEGLRRACERGRDGLVRGAETGERESLQALTDPMISIRTRSDEMGTRSVCTDAQRAVTLCVPRATSFVQRIRSSLLLSGHGSP